MTKDIRTVFSNDTVFYIADWFSKWEPVGYFYARIFPKHIENIQSWAGKELRFMPYIAPEVVQEANGLVDVPEKL